MKKHFAISYIKHFGTIYKCDASIHIHIIAYVFSLFFIALEFFAYSYIV